MAKLIQTDRLELVPMTPDFLRSTLTGRTDEAHAHLALKIPPAWFQEKDFAAMRLGDFESGKTTQPWMPRAIGLRATREMVGYIGFHTPPRPDYLKDLCPDGVEFGYTIFPEYRRNRYAWKAARSLMDWAFLTHDVTWFVASASPENTASLQLIAKLGFRRIGAHLDEIDGPEDIFALKLDRPFGD